MSTVSEFRVSLDPAARLQQTHCSDFKGSSQKNLPEFPSTPAPSFSFRTFSPPASDGFSTIPDIDAVVTKPHPRTLRDADREIAELRLVMIGMGKAMDKWLGNARALTATEEEDPTASAAWQGLRRLQQALLDGA